MQDNEPKISMWITEETGGRTAVSTGKVEEVGQKVSDR